MDAVAVATAGDSAIEALGFEMERSRTLVHFAHEKPALAPVRLTEGRHRLDSRPSASLRIQHSPGDLKRCHLTVFIQHDSSTYNRDAALPGPGRAGRDRRHAAAARLLLR